MNYQLTFNQDVSLLCKKSGDILNVLSRVASDMDQDKIRLVLNPYLSSQLIIVFWYG